MAEKRQARTGLWRRFPRAAPAVAIVLGVGVAVAAMGWAAQGCGWDPRKPFDRWAPEVDEALEDLDAGHFENAEDALERYLGTGACVDGGLALPDRVRERPNGSFDLGLVLFAIGERYGRRFGEEEPPPGKEDDKPDPRRSPEVDCALIVVIAIASDLKLPIELRARAAYLAGNLEFLRKKYQEAVGHYDEALELAPGIPVDASGDAIGRDAAYNRAIALRRIEDQKDAGQDAQPPEPDGGDGGEDASPDGGGDASPDGGEASPDGGGRADSGDGANDGGGESAGADAGRDGGDDRDQDGGAQQHDAGAQPQTREATPDRQQQERTLDELEQAPSYQQQEARKLRRRTTMEDK